MSLKPKNLRPSYREGTGLTLIDAPWRNKYFGLPKQEGCFICRALAAPPRQDARNLLLVRGERAVILLNRYPYTMGALMVAPVGHYAGLDLLDDATTLELMQLVKKSMAILREAIKPEGFNVGVNQGAVAGAGLKDHIHIHVVPRWEGDTNFMTTTSEARVLAEDVDSMYRKLKKALTELETEKDH